MRINELTKVGERTEQRVTRHDAEYDDDGTIIAEAFDETVEVQVPVIGVVYRDATPEEIAEFERKQSYITEPEPTPEERLSIMEDAFAELCEVIFNG